MAKEQVFVYIGKKVITLTFEDFDDNIDVDDLTRIHYENLYGESVTISALLNRIGLLKADVEEALELGKIALSVYEATCRKNFRREAAENAGKCKIKDNITEKVDWIKLTEKSIEDFVLLDKGWQTKKKNVAKRKKDLEYVDSLYWAIQSKDKKLNNLLPKSVPEDFADEIIAGSINCIMLKITNKKYS